jgi:hypothetical protein
MPDSRGDAENAESGPGDSAFPASPRAKSNNVWIPAFAGMTRVVAGCCLTGQPWRITEITLALAVTIW